MESIILDTATQQAVYEIIKVVFSVVGLVLAYYIKRWLATSSFAKKYEINNIITERTIDNAVMYAEKKGLEYSVKGIEKRKLAIEYLDEINPKLVAKYGDKLELMIDRKVAQKFGV